MKEYEEKAVSLALNRAKLQDLTNRLKAARLTCPLFDTARWVSNPSTFYCLVVQTANGESCLLLLMFLYFILMNNNTCKLLCIYSKTFYRLEIWSVLTSRCGMCTALVNNLSISKLPRITWNSLMTVRCIGTRKRNGIVDKQETLGISFKGKIWVWGRTVLSKKFELSWVNNWNGWDNCRIASGKQANAISLKVLGILMNLFLGLARNRLHGIVLHAGENSEVVDLIGSYILRFH